MSNICFRIKQLRNDISLSQDKFSDKIGISRDVLAKIETGKSMPTVETITNIVIYFHINSEWLLTGVGSMLKSEQSTPIYSSVVKESSITSNKSDNELINYTIEKIKRLETSLDNEKRILEILKKPKNKKAGIASTAPNTKYMEL